MRYPNHSVRVGLLFWLTLGCGEAPTIALGNERCFSRLAYPGTCAQLPEKPQLQAAEIECCTFLDADACTVIAMQPVADAGLALFDGSVADRVYCSPPELPGFAGRCAAECCASPKLFCP